MNKKWLMVIMLVSMFTTVQSFAQDKVKREKPDGEKMFAALGMSEEESRHKFGFLLGAFEYGAPPHGGIAFGFDRLCALLGGSESIRDFIAFPKNNSGRDVMLDAPSTIDQKQFTELGIRLSEEKES